MTLEIILTQDIHKEANRIFLENVTKGNEVTYFSPESFAGDIEKQLAQLGHNIPQYTVDCTEVFLEDPTFGTVVIAETEAILVNDVIASQPESTHIILVTQDASKVTVPESYNPYATLAKHFKAAVEDSKGVIAYSRDHSVETMEEAIEAEGINIHSKDITCQTAISRLDPLTSSRLYEGFDHVIQLGEPANNFKEDSRIKVIPVL